MLFVLIISINLQLSKAAINQFQKKKPFPFVQNVEQGRRSE